jgi:serine/threonine protein kinase
MFRNATSCPTFLIANAGPWLVILGVVITDFVIVQRLSECSWVGLDSILSESHIAHVAGVLWALKTSLGILHSYYENLHPTSHSLANSRYFPSIMTYPDGNGAVVEFDYVGFLENTPDCATLRARTKAGRNIVVKFVERYGERAHRVLAGEGLAPALLYCGSPCSDQKDPSYQSISMVVMEYVDGDTLAVKRGSGIDEVTVKTVRSEVQRALELLHDQGLVFGDLRRPNIMITKDGRVKLIDFNWAGEEGQAKYPSLISQEIHWPEGVKAVAVIRREHDLAMLRSLF